MASDSPPHSPPGDKQALIELMNQRINASIPHHRELGLRVTDTGPAEATVVLPYAERLVGNPDTGVLHGGAVTTLMDTACALATVMRLGRRVRMATLDLRVDYLHPATPGRDLVARAECYKLTRSVAFARALAYHEDPADPVASAQGTFMLEE